MLKSSCDLLIIGGGPAGLAAAIAAKEAGVEDLLIVEREDYLGGILNQCIHDGFGLEIFKESLTGPEYAAKFFSKVKKLRIPVMTKTMAISMNQTKEIILSSKNKLLRLKAKAIILAMGCRERTAAAIGIPGPRPAGIYTAGVAQNLINIRNIMIGKRVLILGSGDIGLIMARSLTLEGTQVLAVVEILPYPSGLPRNIVQCLEDFNIPLLLSHTVVNVEGDRRVDSVAIARVGSRGGIVPGTKQRISCDTLLLSVGLISENELSRQAGVILDEKTLGPVVDENGETNIPGVFACGNVLQVHDLVDYATIEARRVGESVASYLMGRRKRGRRIRTQFGHGLRYLLPQWISDQNDVILSMRVNTPGKDKTLLIKDGKRLIKEVFYRSVNPAEMLRVRLKREDLYGIDGFKVTIR